MFIPPESKIVSIEDTREINLLHQNWIPGVTREAEEGGNSIEMFDLLKAALRQRPEYILVGEVRGREAYTLFQAMATGHITLSTVHADSADRVVKRLTKPPIDVPLMLLDSLDIIPIQRSVKLGTRRVRRCTQIIEVTGIDFDHETLKTNELFSWRPDKFMFSGESNVFVEIMDKLNMDESELSEEFVRRVRILEWLRKCGLTDFYSLNKMIFEYNMNPAEVKKRIAHDQEST
jgi:flagellar protein FlaI